MACTHGTSPRHHTTFDLATERSACCDAMVSIHTDDGEWYCKCCYATATPA